MAAKGDGEELTLPHLVKWVEMVTRAETEQAMRAMPVSGSQLFVLVLLDSRGEATSADLARMMRITPQALTTLLRPLREAGYIARRTDEEHARRLLLRLTDRGRKILAQARALSPAIEDSLLSDFSADERKALKTLLARIARRFDRS
jgi:DNA-binding MarR family transcriptional regulator